MSEKRAATEAGVQAASKLIGPLLGAAAVPLGVQSSLYGYGLSGAARRVQPDIERTQDLADQFASEFGDEALLGSGKLDPKGETYQQWRRLRKMKFLEPYIRAGHEGLTTPVTGESDAMDVVRKLRKLLGTWQDRYHTRHYSAFMRSPREAFKVLTTEGLEETKARGMKRAVSGLMKDYERLAKKHGPYEGLRRLYNEPWAKVSLRSPRSVKVFVDKYGNDALAEAKKKQALLFYASRSKLYAPERYGALTAGTSAVGQALGLGGAAVAGIGGYKALTGIARLLKSSGAQVKVPKKITPSSPEEIKETEDGLNLVEALAAGANPFSTKVDVMGVSSSPMTRQEEFKRVMPAVVGKGLLGALVVPSMVRSGIEAVRGLSKQGPYKTLPGGRLRAGAAGAILGTAIPAMTLLRAFRTRAALKALSEGKRLAPKRLKELGKQLGEAPIRAGVSAKKMQEAIEKGSPITSNLAQQARSELFEPNVTIMLNALLGGGLTGYAGYASYARGKRLREAFEQVYGKELPPEVAAVIMDPDKMRRLAKMRRKTMRTERRTERTARKKKKKRENERA